MKTENFMIGNFMSRMTRKNLTFPKNSKFI